jgi:hypothetical protein
METKPDLFSLRVADQQIALARRLVERQLSVVHMLETKGLDATEAKLLLDKLEGSLEALVDHRSLIARARRVCAQGLVCGGAGSDGSSPSGHAF